MFFNQSDLFLTGRIEQLCGVFCCDSEDKTTVDQPGSEWLASLWLKKPDENALFSPTARASFPHGEAQVLSGFTRPTFFTQGWVRSPNPNLPERNRTHPTNQPQNPPLWLHPPDSAWQLSNTCYSYLQNSQPFRSHLKITGRKLTLGVSIDPASHHPPLLNLRWSVCNGASTGSTL